MKDVDITKNPMAQKLAAALVTKKLRDNFNLHPWKAVEEIVKDSAKYGEKPEDWVKFLEDILPGMVTEYLAEVRVRVMKQSLPKSRQG